MARFLISAFADEADPMLAGQIAALSRNGVGLIEVRGVNGKPFVDHTEQEAREVRKQLDGAGIGVGALGSPFGKIQITDNFAPHLDHFKRALGLCHIMGTKRMRMFSFFMPQGEEPAKYRGEVIDRMGAMLEAAQAEGIFCAHENEKGIYGDITERCLDLLTVFAGKLGGIFDPANFIQCGVQPLVACAALKDRVHWMHIKDAIMADGKVVPAGAGDGHVGEVIEALSQAHAGDMMLTLEPHLAIFQGLQGLEREGDTTNIPAYTYKNNHEAFDAAASALRSLLGKLGYKETTEGGQRIWSK